MSAENSLNAVVVVGMHRCGTSAMAGLLVDNGFSPGGPLLGPNEFNERGYFEVEPLVHFGNDLLAARGRSWADVRVGQLADTEVRAPEAEELTRRIDDAFGDVESPIIIKDPRISLAVPTWRAALTARGVTPLWIIMHRSLEEVAASLFRRDGLSLETSAFLWVGYLLAAERGTRGGERLFCDYDDLVDDPVGELRRVLARFPDHPNQSMADSGSFVTAGLRHFHDPRSVSGLGRAVETVEIIAGALSHPTDPRLTKELDRAQVALNQALADIDPLPLDGLHLVQVEALRAREDLCRTLADRTAWITAHDERIEAHDQATEAHGQAINALERTRSAIADELSALAVSVGRIQAEVADVGSGAAALDVDATTGREQLEGLLVTVENLRSDTARVADEIQNHQSHINNHQSWLAQLGRHMEDIAPRVRHVERRLVALRDRQLGLRLRRWARRVLPVDWYGKARRIRAAYKGRRDADHRSPAAARAGSAVGPGVATTGMAVSPAGVDTIRGRIARLRFDDPGDPELTILIPAYEALELTVGCLEAIAEHPPLCSFEVIVVDDCSPSGVLDELGDVAGLRLVRNKENLGFLRSVNAAASQARGEYLYLLNNDAVVTDGAIDALVDTFVTWPDVGAVGSKLLNTDGTVQEAGGIIWRDASAWNYGRGSSPGDPRVDFARQVDYVSAASLLIRTRDWTENGGFDEAFSPAYYEDVDLCLQLTARGKRVIYQSASVVWHHEGGSHGTDIAGAGAKRHQVVNQEVLAEKWPKILMNHCPNAERPEREKLRHAAGVLLVMDARMIYPDRDAGSLRMKNLLVAARDLGLHVVFVPVNLYLESPYVEQLRALGVEMWGSGDISGIEEFLLDHGGRFDGIILSRIEVAERHQAIARRHCPDALLLYDTVDLHFLRQDREVALRGEVTGGYDPARTRRAELAAMESCDVTIVCSPAERDLLAELVPDSRVVVVPTLQDDVRSSASFDERDSVLFVGGFEHPPNADGLRWFIDDVFPKVLELVPDASLDIVGSAMPVEVRQMAGRDIRVHGHVPDLTEYYDRARVAIAPIRFGAGVKGKVTQAMARGVPCVATAIGAEGSRANVGEHLLIADDPGAFAEEIARLYHDDALWRRLAEAGREHSDRHYGIEAAQRELIGLFPDLVGPATTDAARQ